MSLAAFPFGDLGGANPFSIRIMEAKERRNEAREQLKASTMLWSCPKCGAGMNCPITEPPANRTYCQNCQYVGAFSPGKLTAEDEAKLEEIKQATRDAMILEAMEEQEDFRVA